VNLRKGSDNVGSPDAREATPQERVFYDAVKDRLARYLVGFLKLSVRNGVEQAKSAGSGTLIKFQEHYGILTAAHVLSSLPERGEIGLVRFSRSPLQRTKIRMEHTYRKGTRVGPREEDGPDLGFLGLSGEIVGSLKAASDFFDFDKHSSRILDRTRAPSPGLDAVVGVIAERTKIELSGDGIRSWFEASVEIGKPDPAEDKDGYDYISFLPFKLRSDVPPGSYEGVSGGGWWKAFAKTAENGDMSVEQILLFGVPFFQHKPIDGYRKLSRTSGPSSWHRFRDSWN
jgi:hypothetical protein